MIFQNAMPNSSQFSISLPTSLRPLNNDGSSLYADFKRFMIRSFITSENNRPDLLFLIQCKCLYILELTAGFESNLKKMHCKKKKKNYTNLVKDMRSNNRCVKWVNLSMSCLGAFFNECSTFLKMMNDICVDKKQQLYLTKKKNLATSATYFIFCRKNKIWDIPDVTKF